MPECAIPLAHVTIFLALSPKSNSAYMAWNAAREFVQKGNLQPVPNYLQQTPIQREENYLYSHDYEANVSGQSYWDEKEQFYHLKKIGAEQNFSPLYEHRKTLRNQLRKKAH